MKGDMKVLLLTLLILVFEPGVMSISLAMGISGWIGMSGFMFYLLRLRVKSLF